MTDEVDVPSPPISAPVSASATPLGSSYADLAAAEQFGDGDLGADEADSAAADNEQSVLAETLDQEVGCTALLPGTDVTFTASCWS